MVVEQEKVQNQLDALSAKLKEVENQKEPVVAIRAAAVKGSGGSATQTVNASPGMYWAIASFRSDSGLNNLKKIEILV